MFAGGVGGEKPGNDGGDDRASGRAGDDASFLQRNNLTQAEAVLGRSRRQIGYYLEKGPVPRLVALACAGWKGMVRGGGRAVKYHFCRSLGPDVL